METRNIQSLGERRPELTNFYNMLDAKRESVGTSNLDQIQKDFLLKIYDTTEKFMNGNETEKENPEEYHTAKLIFEAFADEHLKAGSELGSKNLINAIQSRSITPNYQV